LKVKGQGGLIAYLGTSDLILLGKFLDGKTLTPEEKSFLKPGITREQVELCLKAMAYQICKDICANLAVLSGQIDAIVLTGGIMYDKRIRQWIRERIEWVAPIFEYPGGDEMGALRDAAIRVLRNEEKVKVYEQIHKY